MYSNSNQGNFGSYSSNPQFAQNPFAQNYQQQQPPQQMQQQQQQAPSSAGGNGGYMNAPIALPQQQQRPFTQYAAYSQYPNGPFRGNLGRNGNSGNRNGKNDPDYKWDQPFLDKN